jgi:hypothetical protein
VVSEIRKHPDLATSFSRSILRFSCTRVDISSLRFSIWIRACHTPHKNLRLLITGSRRQRRLWPTNTSKSLRGADKVRDGDLTTEYREAQAALDLFNASLIEAMTKLAEAREKL